MDRKVGVWRAHLKSRGSRISLANEKMATWPPYAKMTWGGGQKRSEEKDASTSPNDNQKCFPSADLIYSLLVMAPIVSTSE